MHKWALRLAVSIPGPGSGDSVEAWILDGGGRPPLDGAAMTPLQKRLWGMAFSGMGLMASPGAEDRLVALAPGWGACAWAPRLIWPVRPLGEVRTGALPGSQDKGRLRRTRPEAGAVVEVVGRLEDPVEMARHLIESHYRMRFREAFQRGEASSETAQIMAQVAASATKGYCMLKPASVHYNIMAPDSVRLEGFLGVGGKAWREQVGLGGRSWWH